MTFLPLLHFAQPVIIFLHGHDQTMPIALEEISTKMKRQHEGCNLQVAIGML